MNLKCGSLSVKDSVVIRAHETYPLGTSTFSRNKNQNIKDFLSEKDDLQAALRVCISLPKIPIAEDILETSGPRPMPIDRTGRINTMKKASSASSVLAMNLYLG